MLRELSIKNIVLIDQLDLEFPQGLTILTGETGAGKSILLDSLSLILGARGRADLVRNGTDEGQVTALFDIADSPLLEEKLKEKDIDPGGGELIIRRIQRLDGRSKAFINDIPVSQPFLREIGNHLVEIHSQHEVRALIDPVYHLDLLDDFGGLRSLRGLVSDAWSQWQSLKRDLKEAEEAIDSLNRDRAYVEHSAKEIDDLAPLPGEEESLSERRHFMMKSEQLAGDLDKLLDYLGGTGSPISELSALIRNMSRVEPGLLTGLDEGIDKLGKAIDFIHEGEQSFQTARQETDFDPRELERIEERLFALRALARKHRVSVDDLPTLQQSFAEKLAELASGQSDLATLKQALQGAEADYMRLATQLSIGRRDTITRLEAGVAAELPALMLGKARFYVSMTSDKSTPQSKGFDTVSFYVQTNPGTEGGPIGRVASGGELSRFTLALKVVLASETGAPTLIFDEIDTGVGGAVADAIGDRMARLALHSQLMAVTHAPQVAVKADQHFLIQKAQTGTTDLPVTRVSTLSASDRQEEVARMLAGAEITDEARAAAARLIAGANKTP